jgi:intein/homing endonuclease
MMADAVYSYKAEIMVVNINFTLKIASTMIINGSDLPNTTHLLLSKFNQRYIDITTTYKDLFKRLVVVLRAFRHNFRIVTNTLAKAPHR